MGFYARRIDLVVGRKVTGGSTSDDEAKVRGHEKFLDAEPRLSVVCELPSVVDLKSEGKTFEGGHHENLPKL